MKGLNFGCVQSARVRVRSTFFGIVAVLGIALVATACGGDDPEPEDPHCEPPAGERGTAECKRWHAALCDYSSKCGGLSHCDCVDQASGITCTSDTEATTCADRLESASCSDPPFGCDLTDLADRTVAQAGCEQFITTFCAAQQRCMVGDPATCAAEVRTQLDCTRAVALKPAFDQCLAELQTLACSATALPESCEEAVLLEL